MYRVRAPDSGWRGFGEAEMSNLSELYQLSHSTNGLFDGHRGVNAVQVIEVDVVDAQPFERGITGAPDIFRRAIKNALGSGTLGDEAELRGENSVRAPAPERLAHLDFRHAVDICG